MFMPLIDSFKIKTKIPDFSYILESESNIQKTHTLTVDGIQSINVLNIDETLNQFLENLQQNFENKYNIDLEYYWVHFIKYNKGGWQKEHNHSKNEELSFILFLNDDDEGKSYFKINPERNIIVKKKVVKNDIVVFSSLINHGAEICTGNKFIMVGGMRLRGLS